MRKVSNVLTGVLAAAVCVFISLMAVESDVYTMIYNLVFLGIMLVIIFCAWIFGFRRMHQTVRGMEQASGKLVEIYKNKGGISEITVPGSQIFGVEYLDHKYQEYLAYLRKTNSPCDIGDYIGEYEINNYIHRKLVEMVPDILTSLGILGTFVGLVWGLRGFDPQTYEAMTSSVSSLVNGIKVAFITSIYGIVLSMAFGYWLRGALSEVSESLDNFLDKYYLCAVPPTDATAMNHVLSNQREQTKVMKSMATELAEQVAASFEEHVGPAMDHMNQTMESFTEVVTLNQEQLLENITRRVMDSMKREMMSEFTEMRTLLKASNSAQKDYLQFMSEAQGRFQKDFLAGEKELARVMQATSVSQEECMRVTSASQEECLKAMRTQQENLREFVDYMAQVMEKMVVLNEMSNRTLDQVTRQLKEVSAPENPDLGELMEKMDRLVTLMEKQQKQLSQNGKKGLFRSGK